MIRFDEFTVALLVRPHDALELDAAAATSLQDAHLAYLADLHAAGQSVTVLRWMVPGGAMTFSPTQFSRSVAEALGEGFAT